MPSLRRTIPGLLVAAAVLLGGGIQMAAPAASAAVTAPAGPAVTAVPEGIAGVCTALQDGAYRHLGTRLYRCTYVWGLGYYWVEQPAACRAAAPAARETAAC
jgi:hypothetical protein